MQTSGPEKSRTKTKEQTGNQEKSEKKRREEEIRKDNPRTRERSQPATHHTNTKTPLPHHSRVKPEQRTATLPTKQRTYGTKTQQSNEPQQPIHQQSHHPEWLISTNIRHITRYDVISRNEQTGRLTNKQQKQKTVNKTKSVLFRQKWSLSGANPRNKQKTVQRNLEKRWQV